MSGKLTDLAKLLLLVCILILKSAIASSYLNGETGTPVPVGFHRLQALLTENGCVFTLFSFPVCGSRGKFDLDENFVNEKLKVTKIASNYNNPIPVQISFNCNTTKSNLGPASARKCRYCDVHLVTDQTFELGY